MRANNWMYDVRCRMYVEPKTQNAMRRYMMRGMVVSVFILASFAIQLQAITVETIVEEMNARHLKIMEKAGSVKISQSILSLSNGDEMNSRQIILKKDKCYKIESISDMEIDEEKTKNVILFDGKNVWFISPFAGKALMPKDESLLQGIFDDYSKLIPFNSTLLKDEKIGDEECYVIEVEQKAGDVLEEVWVSKDRFVPLKATGVLGGRSFALNFLEYKKIYGIWGIPYRTEVFVGKKPSSIVTVDDVELGIELDDKVFDINSQ
jgi:outer membrane lipoprotein-sorting protein